MDDIDKLGMTIYLRAKLLDVKRGFYPNPIVRGELVQLGLIEVDYFTDKAELTELGNRLLSKTDPPPKESEDSR